MTWTEPLQLEHIFINIFSGTPEIFGILSILILTILAGYFRMNTITLFLMLGIFILMFSGYVGMNLLILIVIFGGLIIGYVISRIFS